MFDLCEGLSIALTKDKIIFKKARRAYKGNIMSTVIFIWLSIAFIAFLFGLYRGLDAYHYGKDTLYTIYEMLIASLGIGLLLGLALWCSGSILWATLCDRRLNKVHNLDFVQSSLFIEWLINLKNELWDYMIVVTQIKLTNNKYGFGRCSYHNNLSTEVSLWSQHQQVLTLVSLYSLSHLMVWFWDDYVSLIDSTYP